ncbi:hypothetical protein ASZ78_007522 [Callipepla squamata]|uniref:Mab-21-like HhH/H2TH-like domain-containing protein n=1 Tax=Callipepla squamata TaxID=9009 RepID=A0A226MPT5_CALSU|nr:hypothetical protein ASZ78_007522 [Callipepla squamata]
MALAFILALLGQILPLAGDEFHEDTFIRMRQREVYLREQMTELLQEAEQSDRDHSRTGMLALLPSLKITSVLCVFGLLFWLIWKIEKKFWEDQDNSDEESCSSGERQEEEEQQEQVAEEQEEKEVKVQDEKNDSGEVEEEKEEVEKLQEQDEEENVQEEEVDQSCFLPESFGPNEDLKELGDSMLYLVNILIDIAQIVVSDTFLPVPERSFVVGSTYEGWGLPMEETVFRFLVSLKPPRGHIFHLELGTTRELPIKNSRIRVELKCTCGQEQDLKMLCFLHTSADELRNQQPSLLDTLCSGPYLDVEKTARWFMALLQNAWKCVPLSAACRLNVVLFKRSCRLQLTPMVQRTFLIDVMFGVQQADTDIFLSSQETEAAYTPSTAWPQTCAVAEAKFFKHIAARAGEDSFHLGCLKVCAYILVGYNFSPYELKTVLMHLLTATPVECWSWRHFVQRMEDILRYLQCCVEEKQLDHFLIRNKAVPAEIILPWEFRVSVPPNLFQHLAQDPDRHEQALYETGMLRDRFTTLLTSGK